MEAGGFKPHAFWMNLSANRIVRDDCCLCSEGDLLNGLILVTVGDFHGCVRLKKLEKVRVSAAGSSGLQLIAVTNAMEYRGVWGSAPTQGFQRSAERSRRSPCTPYLTRVRNAIRLKIRVGRIRSKMKFYGAKQSLWIRQLYPLPCF
jgi:hypothetical protein